jgi:hypothetical protein
MPGAHGCHITVTDKKRPTRKRLARMDDKKCTGAAEAVEPPTMSKGKGRKTRNRAEAGDDTINTFPERARGGRVSGQKIKGPARKGKVSPGEWTRLRILTRDHTLGAKVSSPSTLTPDHNIDSWHGFRIKPAFKWKVNPRPSSLLHVRLTASLVARPSPDLYFLRLASPTFPILLSSATILYFTFFNLFEPHHG